jgi:hypothetical protein
MFVKNYPTLHCFLSRRERQRRQHQHLDLIAAKWTAKVATGGSQRSFKVWRQFTGDRFGTTCHRQTTNFSLERQGHVPFHGTRIVVRSFNVLISRDLKVFAESMTRRSLHLVGKQTTASSLERRRHVPLPRQLPEDGLGTPKVPRRAGRGALERAHKFYKLRGFPPQ